MLYVVDGPQLNTEQIASLASGEVLILRGTWGKASHGYLLDLVDAAATEHRSGRDIFWVGGWAGEPDMRPDAARFWDFYIGRAVRAVGVRLGIGPERRWFEDHKLAGGWDIVVEGDDLNAAVELMRQAKETQKPRPVSPTKFVGNRAAETMYVTSILQHPQPFGVPGGYAAFAQLPDFCDRGYLNTLAPQYLLKQAKRVYATSGEAHEWAKHYSQGAEVIYSKTIQP